MSLTLGLGLPSEKAIEYLRTAGRKAALDREDESTLREFVEYVHRIPAALLSVVHYLTQEKRMRLVELMNPENKHLLAGFHEYDLQKGLRSLIAEQFKRQSPEERLMASVLSVFREPVPLAALQFALPSQDWYEWRLRLEHNTLFDIDRDAGLYDLTRGVREYVYGQIPESTAAHQADGDVAPDLFTRNALHEKAADYYAQTRLPKEQWKAIEDFAPQFEEMYHCRQSELYDRAAKVLVGEAGRFLTLAGYARRVVEERKELAGKPMDEWSKAYNSGSLANAYSDLGEKRKALEYYEQALQIHREVGNRVSEGIVLGSKGLTKFKLGEKEEGIRLVEQALEIARQVEDKMFEDIWLKRLEQMKGHSDDALFVRLSRFIWRKAKSRT